MTRKRKEPSAKQWEAYAALAKQEAEAAQILGGFLRVRGAAVGDPLHEFDIPMSLYTAHSDRYTVVDPVPVAASRPMKAVAGANVSDLTTDAPSEGDPEKENEDGS